MSSFLFCIHNSPVKKVDELLNPTGNLFLQSWSNEDKNFAVSYLKNSPLKGERILDNEKWIIIFSGDLIEYDSIPFKEIIINIEQNKFENFSKFNGIFGIAAYNKETDQLYIISDRRAQYSIFYFINKNSIIISSELSIFTRLLDQPEFNEEWLYDYLYINFPIAETTFFKNVNKLLPATCLKVNTENKSSSQIKYAMNYTKHKNLIDGNDALELAANVLKKRVPIYFKGGEKVACAITGGWDGRTNFAMSLKKFNVTPFTYGTPACNDIKSIKEFSKKLHINHIEILFDDDFIKQLPELIFETVYISFGLHGILRSSLLYVYKYLTSNATKFPLTISGIHYDGLFRGHPGIPFIVSKEMEKHLATGQKEINNEYWMKILNCNAENFSSEITKKLNYLEKEYGNLKSGEQHLCYYIYNAGPNHFGGELKIANNFTVVRVPAWDSEIIDLALKLKYSTLSYSQLFGYPKGKRDEVILQSYIIKKLAPEMSGLRIRHTTPSMVLKGEAHFQAYQLYRKIISKINKTILPKNKFTLLEDWDLWLNEIYRNFIDELIFDSNSLIRNYLNHKYLEKLRTERDILMIGKLATTEIILRLIKNKWERFW